MKTHKYTLKTAAGLS